MSVVAAVLQDLLEKTIQIIGSIPEENAFPQMSFTGQYAVFFFLIIWMQHLLLIFCTLSRLSLSSKFVSLCSIWCFSEECQIDSDSAVGHWTHCQVRHLTIIQQQIFVSFQYCFLSPSRYGTTSKFVSFGPKEGRDKLGQLLKQSSSFLQHQRAPQPSSSDKSSPLCILYTMWNNDHLSDNDPRAYLWWNWFLDEMHSDCLKQSSFPGFDWFAATIFLMMNGSSEKAWKFLFKFSTLLSSPYLWLHRLHASVSTNEITNLMQYFTSSGIVVITKNLQTLPSWVEPAAPEYNAKCHPPSLLQNLSLCGARITSWCPSC